MSAPVQVLVVGFEAPSFSGEVLAELTRLRERGVVRLVDVLLVERGDDGTFEILDPPQRFVTHSLPATPGASEVTAYLLQEEGDGTRLTITNAGSELLPEDGRWSAMEQNAFGFGMMLENLRAYLETQDLPTPGGF